MSTKTRRPVAMATPPPQNRSRSMYSEGEKQSLLDNFDLEVSDKTRAFKSTLQGTLSSFLLRQETEILKIPRDLRGMTLGELEGKWGGSWAGTVQRIARERIEEREREEAKARAQAEAEAEEAKGKRKRTLESSPTRNSKNARRYIPGSAKKPLGVSTSADSVKQSTAKTPRSKPILASGSKTPSGLPQNHIFNPSLPPTPSFARAARRNESFFSANGSPITLTTSPQASSSRIDPSDVESDNNDDDDDDELPDPEALEAKILARPQQSPRSKSSKPSHSSYSSHPSRSSTSAPSRRMKRGPSLMFRQSVNPNEIYESTEDGQDALLSNIPLSDGRTVSFDPLNLSPGRVDAEIEEGGLGESEKQRIKVQVKEEVFKALTAKMEKWKVL